MRVLLVLCSLVFASPAIADVASGLPRFTWTQPATWSDGAPLAVAQITAYQLSCSGASTLSTKVTAAATIPPYTIPVADRLGPGAYTCTLAVYARRTATSPEVLGLASSPVPFTVPQPTPGAPVGLSIE